MNKIDYQALREAAEKAGEDKWQAKKINGDFFVIRHGSYTRQHGYTSYQPIAEIDCKQVRDFVAKANPATVLELLDELEAAKKRIAELEAEPVSQTYKLNQLSGNSPVTPDGWVMVPKELTPEMMRAVQIRSELGGYATSNLSGAYNMFSEFWNVAVSAAPKVDDL
ncbi:ead/Ea22-like family protein [Escherichia coli]|nr:ead/Ea22-like family protein [Escherichia coli]EFH0905830.1 ead/Ea22-like family protein [Escherichia coli]EFI0566085.1 ead/Ea22-like family protein [Escherichia coli]EFI0595743.1 ead/Ea22-like family protein [Escherichia coli]EFI0599987.1 ead/Ea22-like family protein [Escherichia coli]